jgi:hypothetical protein
MHKNLLFHENCHPLKTLRYQPGDKERVHCSYYKLLRTLIGQWQVNDPGEAARSKTHNH